MRAKMIEHRGVVQRIDGSKAVVAMETAGCSSCGQGSSCGIGKMASGRPATLLTIPVSGDIKAGDFVLIGLPESKLTLSALLGYLFPAFAMLLGAWLGRPRHRPHRHRPGAEPDAGSATDSSFKAIPYFPSGVTP